MSHTAEKADLVGVPCCLHKLGHDAQTFCNQRGKRNSETQPLVSENIVAHLPS